MSQISVEQLIQERQNQFIEKRTIIESEVNKFLASLANLDPAIQQQCNVSQLGSTAREVLPALWAEPFDETAYNAQKANLDNYISAVQAVQDKLNEEAIRCLQQP